MHITLTKKKAVFLLFQTKICWGVFRLKPEISAPILKIVHQMDLIMHLAEEPIPL